MRRMTHPVYAETRRTVSLTCGRNSTREAIILFMRAFQSSVLLTALFVGAAVLPSVLRAQQSTVRDLGVTAPLASAQEASVPETSPEPVTAPGPRVGSTGFTWPVAATPLDTPTPFLPQSRGAGFGSNVALMGVGGAALVVGLMIGGDGGTIVAITGGVVGLVGLYRFLQ